MNPRRSTVMLWCAASSAACLVAAGALTPAAATPRTPNAPSVNRDGAIPAQIVTNERTAFYYFVQKGLSGIQSAGIIGNLDVESGVDPNASGGGRGIAQWLPGGRWDSAPNDNVVWYANQHGQSPTSLGAQLDFIWYELTTFSSYGLGPLRAATSISSATQAFEDDFEGCGACNTSGRIAYAQSAYQRYPVTPATTGGTVVASNSTEVDFFTRSSANHLMMHGYRPGSGWQAAKDLGAPTTGLTWDPDASTSGGGHIDVAARDAGGHLVMRSLTNGTWSPWYRYGDTSLLSSPSVVDDGSAHVVVFWLGAGHQLQQRSWQSGVGWSAVTTVPGVSTIASGPDASSWQPGSGHIDVVYRTTTNALWSVTYDAHWRAPSAVDPAHALPGTPAAVDPGSGTTGQGDFSVYVTTTDGNIYHASGNTLTGVWTAWYPIPGSPHSTAAPDTTTMGATGVYAVTGSSGTLRTSHYTNPNWTAWQAAF